jgi:RNA polymerase sigma factor (sigma-70 family)
MSPWLSDRFLSSQSDERLAALASAGSERAFAAIVQRYRRPLLGFARHLAGSGDAEDLVQQTFTSALAAMRTGVEVRHLRGWLYQILRHASTQASKRAPVPAELGPADLVTPSAQQAAEVRMLTAEALAALAQLPARQHQAMVATAIHGQSRAEVAQLLGLSEGAVRQLVHRAREALRTAVTAITPYPLAQALAGGSPGGGIAEVVAGAGAGSAGALVIKIGAVVVSGVVATGIVTSTTGGRSHSARHAHNGAVATLVSSSSGPRHNGRGARLASLVGGGSTAARLPGGESRRGRGGPGPSGGGSDGGPGTSSDGSSGGPSSGSGSSDGGGTNSSSSGGPSATTATSGDGGSGSSDGGMTTTTTSSGSDGGSGGGGSGSSDGGTTTTTTTTTSGSDGGGSGGSGSGDTTTTSTTDGH